MSPLNQLWIHNSYISEDHASVTPPTRLYYAPLLIAKGAIVASMESLMPLQRRKPFCILVSTQRLYDTTAPTQLPLASTHGLLWIQLFEYLEHPQMDLISNGPGSLQCSIFSPFKVVDLNNVPILYIPMG